MGGDTIIEKGVLMETDVVVNADNLDYLKNLPDDSIDCIYCDPPFNTGVSWVGRGGGFVDIYKETCAVSKRVWVVR